MPESFRSAAHGTDAFGYVGVLTELASKAMDRIRVRACVSVASGGDAAAGPASRPRLH